MIGTINFFNSFRIPTTCHVLSLIFGPARPPSGIASLSSSGQSRPRLTPLIWASHHLACLQLFSAEMRYMRWEYKVHYERTWGRRKGGRNGKTWGGGERNLGYVSLLIPCTQFGQSIWILATQTTKHLQRHLLLMGFLLQRRARTARHRQGKEYYSTALEAGWPARHFRVRVSGECCVFVADPLLRASDIGLGRLHYWVTQSIWYMAGRRGRRELFMSVVLKNGSLVYMLVRAMWRLFVTLVRCLFNGILFIGVTKVLAVRYIVFI